MMHWTDEALAMLDGMRNTDNIGLIALTRYYAEQAATAQQSNTVTVDMLTTGLADGLRERAFTSATRQRHILSRPGVMLSEAQKEQIMALQETGDMASAQRIILDELARRDTETEG